MTEIGEAYEAGYDCAINGANTDNCNFKHFATLEHTKSWELGNRNGKGKNNGNG